MMIENRYLAMKTKGIIIVLFILSTVLTSLNCYSQGNRRDTVQVCSQLMKELGYFWKLDSLGNNGFRLYTYNKLLRCKIDEVTIAFLFSKLGKPNRVWAEGHGVVYRYNFFDYSKMPKGYDAPLSCRFLSFVFRIDEKYLLFITEGDGDL